MTAATTEKLYIVITTVSSQKEAEDLSNYLLENAGAACVSQIPQITSSYHWKGKIENCEELILLIKVIETNKSGLIQKLEANHPYKIPEIIVLESHSVNDAYLRWATSIV